MKPNKVLFWDFDGTLGYRRDGMWGAAMIEALKEYEPETSLTAPDFRPFLMSGFPWHHPEISHTHITTSEEWWQPILTKFVQGYMHFGINDGQAVKLAGLARQKFIDIERWTLFDDTTETLVRLRESGWKHAIISNHMPELNGIIQALGIGEMIDYFINSAFAGYEKPNRKIYEYAFALACRPTQAWMIGDNIEADYLGAEAAGINAILVRNTDSRAARNYKNLREVIRIIEG